MLSVSGLRFAYRGGVEVVRDVSFAIAAGEVVSILGANGSGKSSLLKLLARVEEAADGEIALLGKPMRSYSRRDWARQIGYLAQQTDVSLPLRGIDVVVSGRAPFLRRFEWEGVEDYDLALTALAQVDAAPLADRPADELSGGELKRLLLARAMLGRPPLIILDEPFASLDVEHVQRTARLFRGMAAAGSAVIFSSHDVNWSATCSDRMMVMREGRLVTDERPDRLFDTARMRELFGVESEIATSAGGRRWVVPTLP